MLASAAQAQVAFRCQHTIELPNSCSARPEQYSVEAINMNGWAQVGCLRSDTGHKTSWTTALYAYSGGEPINVSRSNNTTPYPSYSWTCPTPQMTAAKVAKHRRLMRENADYQEAHQ